MNRVWVYPCMKAGLQPRLRGRFPCCAGHPERCFHAKRSRSNRATHQPGHHARRPSLPARPARPHAPAGCVREWPRQPNQGRCHPRASHQIRAHPPLEQSAGSRCVGGLNDKTAVHQKSIRRPPETGLDSTPNRPSCRLPAGLAGAGGRGVELRRIGQDAHP